MVWLKSVLFTLLVPGTVAVLVPRLLAPDAGPSVVSARGLGLLPVLAGAGIYFWCLWDFTRTGRGTPAPLDPPRVLVARGLYRYSRNPMYVGVLLVILGQALFFRSWAIALYAAGFAGVVHLFVKFYEEPTLSALFGPAYAEYVKRVPRWLVLACTLYHVGVIVTYIRVR